MAGSNPSQSVNAQTGTTYTFVPQDCSRLVTFTNSAAVAVTLPQAGSNGQFINGDFIDVKNEGTGVVTITPTTSTISGAAAITIQPGSACRIVSDAISGATGNYHATLGTTGTASSYSSPGSNAQTLTPVSLALTAHAGGGQTNALALTSLYNEITTVGTAADSVKLPLAAVGLAIVVANAAASNSMQVFGAGTDTINNVATGTGVAQAAGKSAVYYCTAAAPAGNWYRVLSA